VSGEIRVYVPRETAAVSLGADEVAEKIAALENVELVRNGSWGASWLEPLVEVVVEGKRIAYGPVRPEDVPGLATADFLGGGEHALRLGPTQQIPYLINQDRWTFHRVGLIDPLSIDEYSANGGFEGLIKAIEIGPAAILEELQASGLRGRGGAAFPTSVKWQTVADAKGDQTIRSTSPAMQMKGTAAPSRTEF